MIEASVQKKFGGFSLDGSLSDGGFICLAGKNGSGKTTLLRIIAGLLKPDGGTVKVDGKEITCLPVERRGIVLVTPHSCLPELRVEEHLLWGAKLKGAEVSQEKLATVKKELAIDFQGKVRTLSLGMRERVSLATALLSAPAGILVDEAFANLHDREKFVSTYRAIAASCGVDVVFSTQDESDAPLAEHLYWIEDGRTSRRF